MGCRRVLEFVHGGGESITTEVHRGQPGALRAELMNVVVA
jgi:hypothetical protein